MYYSHTHVLTKHKSHAINLAITTPWYVETNLNCMCQQFGLAALVSISVTILYLLILLVPTVVVARDEFSNGQVRNAGRRG